MNETVSKKKRFPVWIILSVIVIIAACTVGGVALAKSMSPQRKASKQLELARKYVSELNYEQAIIAYEAVIKIDPKNADAYIELAEVYVEIGEPEKAKSLLEEALKNVPEEDEQRIKRKQRHLEEDLETENMYDSNVPSDDTATSFENDPTIDNVVIESMRSAKAGDTIILGSYEQDNDQANGKEPIEWIVLSNSGDELYVFSKYSLDCRKYNEELKEVTWETSTLRKWLNDDLYNSAFSGKEQSLIKTAKVKNDDNPDSGEDGGSDTLDKIFLPSTADLLNADYGFAEDYYDSDESKVIGRRCAATAYAQAQGVLALDDYLTVDGEPSCWWWLRSVGYNGDCAAYVFCDGEVLADGVLVNQQYGVRPALVIDLR